jgi:hypothetical protein
MEKRAEIAVLMVVISIVGSMFIVALIEKNSGTIEPPMRGEDFEATNVQFINDAMVNITLHNFDKITITITNASIYALAKYGGVINGSQVALSGPSLAFNGTIGQGQSVTFTLTLPSGTSTFTDGTQYQIELQTAKNDEVVVQPTCTGL